jgi:hypothetical protein
MMVRRAVLPSMAIKSCCPGHSADCLTKDREAPLTFYNFPASPTIRKVFGPNSSRWRLTAWLGK